MTAKTAPGWTQASMAGKLTWKGEQGKEKDEATEQLHLEAGKDCRTRQGRRGWAGPLMLVQLIDRLQAKIHHLVLWCGQTDYESL